MPDLDFDNVGNLIEEVGKLHNDLRPYFSHVRGMPMLRHPLVYQVPFMMAEIANKSYAFKKVRAAQYLEGADHMSYLMIHERPYRLQAFTKMMEEYHLSDKNYWECLKSIWLDSENMWQNRKQWGELLRARPESRHLFMDKVEQSRLNNLLATDIKLYRGMIEGQNEDGHSWTLDYEMAAWFAKRFASSWSRGIVEVATVEKSNIHSYNDSRGEREVLLLEPSQRRTIERIRLT